MNKYKITGMSCQACSNKIEKVVSNVEGVSSCSVNLLTSIMTVEGVFNEDDMIKAINNAGYGIVKNNPTKKSFENNLIDDDSPLLLKRLIVSSFFLIFLMYISMGHMMLNLPLPQFFIDNHVATALLELLLTIIIMVINQKFFISGFKSLFHFSPNMDSLIAIGSSASFIYSTISLFLMIDASQKGNIDSVSTYMNNLYFESTATILTLITLGKTLEAKAKGKTTDALKSLAKLAPKTARIINGKKEIIVEIDKVQKKDIFLVKPGECIPVDGIIIEGFSDVDESILTGESMPSSKKVNDKVAQGTINQTGFLKCIATKVGSDTTISQIIQMVSDASSSKAKIAKVADKVSKVFVPVVMIISFITFIIWLLISKNIGYSLARSISVLVISCPCALGLATPVAIMVGSGIGAKNGILFKTSLSLEELGKARIVALDKTGTITLGRPVVTDIIPNEGVKKEDLLKLAYSLEKKSEHPVAFAINEIAKKEKIESYELTDFKAIPGNGIKASLQNSILYGGSYQFINGIVKINGNMKDMYNNLSKEGKTPLFFSNNKDLYGIIAVADTIKDDSRDAISELKRMNLEVVMLTGDNEVTANAIGELALVDEVVASVFPDGKKDVINNLQKKGYVIMVGDGINDAIALKAANVGVAIGAGSDIAIDACDVVLMNSSLSSLVSAIKLSRITLRNIHENLFWAFIYNIIGIPLAAGMFINILGLELSPMFAALAMSLSSFCVVMNALRLNIINISKQKNKSKSDHNSYINKTILIEGMMCEHCQMHVKKALDSLDGVINSVVNYETGYASLSLNKDISDSILISAIANEGYKVIDIK